MSPEERALADAVLFRELGGGWNCDIFYGLAETLVAAWRREGRA